jgi:RHS repeat-associated protein
MNHTSKFLFKRVAVGMLVLAASVLLGPGAAAQGLRPWEDPAHVNRMLFEARQRVAQEEQRRQAQAEARRQESQAAIAMYSQMAAQSRINLPSFRYLDFIAQQKLNADLVSRFYPIRTHFPLLSGAAFELPWGSFNGGNLIALDAVKRGQNGARVGTPVTTWLELAHPQGGSLSYPGTSAIGWRFEPAGMLQGELRVVQSGDAPAPVLCLPGQYCEPPPPNTRPCLFTLQYRYVGPGGVLTFLPEDGELAFSLPPNIPVSQHGCDATGCFIKLDESYYLSKIPARMRSTTGAVVLDLSDLGRPVMRYPDGTTETFGKGAESAGWVSPTQFEEIFAPAAARPSTTTSMRIFGRVFTARVIDANGNTTRFRSKLETVYITLGDQKIPMEYPTARETSVEDSLGRVTRFIRDAQGNVTEIRAPGPFGRAELEKVWTLQWQQVQWDPGKVMPDVRCRFKDPIYDELDFDPAAFEDCPRMSYTTLAAMIQPDGTRYSLAYDLPDGQKSWGALTEVTTPGGAVHRFTYGDADSFFQWPASLPVQGAGYVGRDVIAHRETAYTFFCHELNKRGLESTTIFPNGPQGPGFRSEIRDEKELTWFEVDFRSRGPAQCQAVAWRKTLHSELSGREPAARKITWSGTCVQDPPAFNDQVSGQTIATLTADETGRLVEASYYGNLGRDLPLADPSPAGQMFVQSETAVVPVVHSPVIIPLDARPTQVIRFRDGLTWRESIEYDRDGPAHGGTHRSLGNVVKKKVISGQDVLIETQTDHLLAADYQTRNLVRLPTEKRVFGMSDGAWKLLARTGVAYDQLGLEASKSDRLDMEFTSKYRGNPTTATVYNTGASDGTADADVPASIATATRYYDNGAIYEVSAPGNRVTTTAADFASCSASQPIRTTTTLGPDPGNGTGRPRVTTRTDCFTALPVSVTDPNSNRTCSQYDGLGRLIETALPGDRLSTLSSGIRDDQCPTSGSQGRGPTTWSEHRHTGRIGSSLGGSDPAHQHTITWSKNGLAQGTYVKIFSDGLGRPVQICDQIDPATNGGASEICTFKDYDDTGKADAEYLPYHNSTPAEQVTLPPPGLQYTLTRIDPLGRPTYTHLMNSGIQPTTLGYGSDRGLWVTEITHPGGKKTITGTNLLGQTVQVSRESDLCQGGFCTTETVYDALGRALAVIGPLNADGTGGHEMDYAYDGLGRRKKLTDPSLGEQRFKYDELGNLIERGDARGRKVSMAYDPLNRVLTKTLTDPGGGTRPAEQVVTYTYDGATPGAAIPASQTIERAAAVAPAAGNGNESGRTLTGRSLSVTGRGGGSRTVEGPFAGNKGKLTYVANGLIGRGYAYDALGRVVAESAALDGELFNQGYRYGYPGRAGENGELGSVLLSEFRPDGEIYTMAYDTDGKLAGLSTQAPGRAPQVIVAGIQRNAHNDILEVTYGNGTITRFSYDENRSWRLDGKQVLKGGTALMDLAFNWDDNGNLLELANRLPGRGDHSWEFDYDSLDQLIWAATAGGRLELLYGYTGTGNLIRKSMLVKNPQGQWSVNTLDQAYGGNLAGPYAVTASGADRFSYDAGGNLTATTAGGGLQLEWNAENMPVRTFRGGNLAAEKWFLGESLWKRRERPADTGAPQTTLYPFPALQVENGAYRHRFGAWAERDPADGRLRFFHRDQVGSSVLVTDEQGQVVHEAVYQPYGEDWLTPVSGYDPQRKFGNKEKERFSGLYDFGARLYLPQTGRWISADSVLDGLNRYAYVANNPLRYVDPSGHDKHPVMYAPGSDYAKWREAIIKEYGAEVGTALLEGVAAIDDAVRKHEKILFLAQGILNKDPLDMANHLAWEEFTKTTAVSMVNANGPWDAANGRSNPASAKALAYLMDYAMGAKKVKAADILIGTHSNGANVMNEALGILKKEHGRTLSGTTALIMAPNTTVATIYSIKRQVGNSQVLVYDSVRDTPLMLAGVSGKGKGYIDYNHVSRSTRPANVHFYQVNLPYSVNNHEVKNYFQAIEKKKFWEYKP